MILTSEDMYRAFLDGIMKVNTGIVEPDQFNRIVNEWGQLEWLAENLPKTEQDQKQLDDLERLRCATDGVFEQPSSTVLFPIAPETGSDYSFLTPKYTTTNINNRLANGSVSTQNYPRYLRLLNIQFKINIPSADECNDVGVTDWREAKLMRSDQRSVIMNSSLRKPRNRKLYYEMLDGRIRLITGTTAVGYSMRLEYLRYPADIVYDYPGGSHVDPEFSPQQNKEMVDVLVRTYLERVKDPRYQSFLNEELIKANNK